MGIKSLFFKAAHTVREGPLGSGLAKTWHLLAPPITITKRIYGVRVCLDLRDSLFWWANEARRIEQDEGYDRMLKGVAGDVWDVGCNVGIFSLYAASQGHNVVAFDISPKAIGLLERSARLNGFKMVALARAFSVVPYKYSVPRDADTRNKPEQVGPDEAVESLPYKEVVARYGTPAFIKIDIEHGEVDFLKSPDFRDWIQKERITCLVELHDPAYWNLVWKEVPHVKFDVNHVMFNPPEHVGVQ